MQAAAGGGGGTTTTTTPVVPPRRVHLKETIYYATNRSYLRKSPSSYFKLHDADALAVYKRIEEAKVLWDRDAVVPLKVVVDGIVCMGNSDCVIDSCLFWEHGGRDYARVLHLFPRRLVVFEADIPRGLRMRHFDLVAHLAIHLHGAMGVLKIVQNFFPSLRRVTIFAYGAFSDDLVMMDQMTAVGGAYAVAAPLCETIQFLVSEVNLPHMRRRVWPPLGLGEFKYFDTCPVTTYAGCTFNTSDWLFTMLIMSKLPIRPE